MNTTRSISDIPQINCTMLGGLGGLGGTGARGDLGARKEGGEALDVTAVLINSGNSHMRLQNLESLTRSGFARIISFENDAKNYNIEDFVQKFPHVQFIIPLEKAADGDLINLAVREIATPYFLVLRDSISITSQILSRSIFQKIAATNAFCTVPRFFSRASRALPVIFIPGVRKSVLKIDSSVTVSDNLSTLYPFLFIGLYDTKKFLSLGGYDPLIRNPYWQNLDLSFRAWLWGERINVSTSLQYYFTGEVSEEDSTPDLSQLRFYLKNLAVLIKNGRAEIPLSKFLGYKMRSSCGLFETARQFSSAREWVAENSDRFVMDAYRLISEWGSL